MSILNEIRDTARQVNELKGFVGQSWETIYQLLTELNGGEVVLVPQERAPERLQNLPLETEPVIVLWQCVPGPYYDTTSEDAGGNGLHGSRECYLEESESITIQFILELILENKKKRLENLLAESQSMINDIETLNASAIVRELKELDHQIFQVKTSASQYERLLREKLTQLNGGEMIFVAEHLLPADLKSQGCINSYQSREGIYVDLSLTIPGLDLRYVQSGEMVGCRGLTIEEVLQIIHSSKKNQLSAAVSTYQDIQKDLKLLEQAE